MYKTNIKENFQTNFKTDKLQTGFLYEAVSFIAVTIIDNKPDTVYIFIAQLVVAILLYNMQDR